MWKISKTQTNEKILDMNIAENRAAVQLCEPLYNEYIHLLTTQGRCAARKYLNRSIPTFSKAVDIMLVDNGIETREVCE